MAEMEIKRVNFFDGQFLKEDEFIAFDAYHLHMRRRWAFVMFDKSGVVQATPTDLTLASAPGLQPGEKRIVVKAGMAIGKRGDLAEAKEVVLRNDTEVNLADPQWGLVANDIAVISVQYQEEPVKDPPSEGDIAGDTRIKEKAAIRVHRNTIPVQAPGDEPYVGLGEVNFNNLTITSANRRVAYLNGGLVAPVAAPPTISLTPNSGSAGGPALAVAVSATGNLNLSTATNASVVVSPAAGITFNVTNQTANAMTLTLTIQPGAAAGIRTVTVTVNGQSATANFTVQAGLQLVGFTPVDQPNGNNNLVINGSGFAANQQATVQFPGAPGLVIPAASVTATHITIPMANIPDAATPGSTTVTTGGSSASLPVTPPPKITNTTPAAAPPGGFVTLTGVRLSAARVFLIRNNAAVMDKSTFNLPGESISATQIVFQVPGNLTPGNCQIRVATAGGTITGATITIT